ncbi:MAG: hypothetical protein ACJ78M_14680 [Gemmatimonadaceae bacterium]
MITSHLSVCRSRFPLPASPFPLFLFLLAGCVVEGAKKAAPDTTASASIVTVTPVNRGSGGMRETIRWALSPNRRAILAVHDPVGIEGDPIPDGFFFGDEEREFQIQVDSVWDVSPSPDWKSIAFGRAYTIQKGESGEINLLPEVSRATSIDSVTLRAASFPTSGGVDMRAVAQPGVIRIPVNPRQQGAVDSARPRLFPIARGWRVRWTSDGTTVALGNSPGRSYDDDSSQTWSALDPTTGALHGTLPASATVAEAKFTEGPTLELGNPIPVEKSPPITVDRGNRRFQIQSERGVITLVETTTGATKKDPTRVIGAGIALAATAGGRYVLALAPRSTPEPHGMSVQPVVYTVTW